MTTKIEKAKAKIYKLEEEQRWAESAAYFKEQEDKIIDALRESGARPLNDYVSIVKKNRSEIRTYVYGNLIIAVEQAFDYYNHQRAINVYQCQGANGNRPEVVDWITNMIDEEKNKK